MKNCLLSLFALSVMTSLFSCNTKSLPKAAETGDSAQIQALIHKGIPVDQRGGSMDETAIMIAARHGN